jgi:hypothetical protein
LPDTGNIWEDSGISPLSGSLKGFIMSASPTNPFVLPGMGQTGEQASNPLLASMEMMRQAFAGLTSAGGFAAGMPISPPMNPEDLERRISELKTVENWLKLNLSMLSSTIQGMEVQLATIATLRSFASSMGAANASGSEGPSALEVMLGLQPQSRTEGATSFASAFSQATPAPQAAAQESRQTEPPAATQDAPEPATQAATESDSQTAIPAAAQAWWEMLKTQFGQVAAATAASMSSAASSATSKAKKTTTPAARSTKSATKTPRKQATKKATRQATQRTSTATRSRVAKSAK